MSNDRCDKHETLSPIPTTSEVVQLPAPAPKPDATWTTDALLACAMALLAEAGVLARKTTVVVLRAGLALWLLRERLKTEGNWCKFQKDTGLPRTSVWEAIQLHLRVAERGLTEDQVGAMPWPEAKEFFGISKPRKDEAGDDKGPVEAVAIEPNEDSACATVDMDALDQIDQGIEADTAAQPAGPAAPTAKAKNADKPDQGELSPCEIDAATDFIKKVGGWSRAVRVIELVKVLVQG